MQLAERALARLAGPGIRRRGYERLAALAGLDLPAGCCWVLARLARLGPQPGAPFAGSQPQVDTLVARHLVIRDHAGTLSLSASGAAAAGRLSDARRAGLRELLTGWSPEQYTELAELLNRLSARVLHDHRELWVPSATGLSVIMDQITG